METEPTVQVLRVPLVGRSSFLVETGIDLTNEVSITAAVFKNPSDAEADVLFTKTTAAGTIIVTDAADIGEIFFELLDADVLKLNPNRVYHLRLNVTDIEAAKVVRTVTYKIIPVNHFIATSFPLVGVDAMLSTRYKNTIVSALGEAYLDTVVTVGQTVGCMLQIYVDGDQPPQDWVLRASTDASEAGAKRRAGDYGALNQKVWFRM